MPLRARFFASIKAWTADLSRESRTLLALTLHALRLMGVLLILCGVVFPLIVFGIGQVAFPGQADGSLVRNARGQIIGSRLIGQSSTSPYYFHGRPSAVGYDASNSGGSNLGPLNPQLLTGNGTLVTVAPGATPPPGGIPVPGKRGTYSIPASYLGVAIYAAQFRAENGLAPDTPLPADIVTASASGLDPDISVAAAELQVNRVVGARRALGRRDASITADAVRALITQATEGRQLGFLGEPRVNVLALNLALDAAYGPPPALHGATGSR
jgi:K+-transporting ATPase ATPase C chain